MKVGRADMPGAAQASREQDRLAREYHTRMGKGPAEVCLAAPTPATGIGGGRHE